MAATGYTPIYLYYSSTATNQPSAGNLGYGELAINITDGYLFYKDNANAIQKIGIKNPATTSGTLAQFASTTSSQLAGVISDETGSGSLVFGTSPTLTTPVINGFSGDTSVVNIGSGQFYKDTSGNIGLNTTTPNPLSGPFTPYLTVKGVSYDGVIQTLGSRGDGDNTGAGQFNFLQNANTTNKMIAQVTSETEGTTANNRGGRLMFFTKADGASSTTEQLRISSTGNVTLYTGNLVIGTSGKGIDFSATAGTGTSELLADYEEGTWTPVIWDGTNNATMSGNTSATYTKVGNMVTVYAWVETSSLGSVTGGINISGLPFTASSSASAYCGVTACQGFGLNITAGQSVAIRAGGGLSYLRLNVWNAAAGTSQMTATEWSADGGLMFSMSYPT